MNQLRHKLMKEEAETRLNSARILNNCNDRSDSAYLLELLAFELLIKIMVEKDTQTNAPNSHKYDELFTRLSAESQTNVINLACERIGPSKLTTDYVAVLKELGNNFINLRYPYKMYNKLTESEYAERGQEWKDTGNIDSVADYRYHPEELLGLIHATRELTNGC